MLLNGPRYNWLSLTRPYTQSPQQMTWRMLGTGAHSPLSESDHDRAIMEERLSDGVSSGQIDNYEVEDGVGVLTDYKISGSYKIAKALGIEKTMVEDPSGEVYKKSGKWGKAGDVKKIPCYTPNPAKAECFDWTYQLNQYRRLLERHGFTVDRLQIQCIVRDGGTFVAENRGIYETMYLLPIEIVDDKVVDAYFKAKADELEAVLCGGKPRLCNDTETWDGIRCKRFCPVAKWCKQYGDNPYLGDS